MNAPLTSGPRPAGEMSASDRARKPGAVVSAAATAPPSEWPTRCAAATPSSASVAATAAVSAASVASPANGEAPWPGRSRASAE